MITFENYFISTEVQFTMVPGQLWQNIIKLNRAKYPFHKSPKSSSCYWHDVENGLVYRMSDHWGNVASCKWSIDQEYSYSDNVRTTTIAVASISDFKNIQA